MFYLYLKTHNTTGLQYLGQTVKDPFVYKGSGTHWMRHIKKHGYNVTTVVLYETPFKEEIKELGLYFSDLWNIVDSREFANLCKEDGYSITGLKMTDDQRKNVSKAVKGIPKSEEHKQKLADINKGNTNWLGKTHSEETKQKMRKPKSEDAKLNMMEARKDRTLSEEHKRNICKGGKGRIHSEETKHKMSESAKNRRKV